jgi:hypothetical protein
LVGKLLIKYFVISGPVHQDKGHVGGFEPVNEGLLGIKAIAGDDQLEPGMGRSLPISRLAALISQSCFSAPSLLAMSSGAGGMTSRIPGQTIIGCRIWRSWRTWSLAEVFLRQAGQWIFSNVGDIKKGFQVVAVKAFFQAQLKLQQGRVLEKHQGKAAHKAIVQGVIQRTLSRVFALLQAQ